jgi:CheY-like chemotaxis protein
VSDASDEALARRGELLCVGRHLLEEPGGTVELGQAQPDGGGRSFELFVAVLPPVPLSKVLVVDDNPDVVALFRRFLHDQPYRLFQATSALSASRMALDLRPDVIILDVVIPAQDGWDILRQLRSQPTLRDTPVVVCSVLPEQALAMSLGVADFLAKPVTRDRLIAMLQRHGSPQLAMR